MPNTTLSALPYPTLTDPNNPPTYIQALATALDPLVTPQIQTYAVVWSQSGGSVLSIGNGTLLGQYVKVGRLVSFNIQLTRGSTTNFGTTTYNWSLPFAAANNLQAPGTGVATVGGTFRPFILRMPTSSALAGVRATDESPISNTSFAWATGDTIAISGTYLSAS